MYDNCRSQGEARHFLRSKMEEYQKRRTDDGGVLGTLSAFLSGKSPSQQKITYYSFSQVVGQRLEYRIQMLYQQAQITATT